MAVLFQELGEIPSHDTPTHPDILEGNEEDELEIVGAPSSFKVLLKDNCVSTPPDKFADGNLKVRNQFPTQRKQLNVCHVTMATNLITFKIIG